MPWFESICLRKRWNIIDESECEPVFGMQDLLASASSLSCVKEHCIHTVSLVLLVRPLGPEHRGCESRKLLIRSTMNSCCWSISPTTSHHRVLVEVPVANIPSFLRAQSFHSNLFLYWSTNVQPQAHTHIELESRHRSTGSKVLKSKEIAIFIWLVRAAISSRYNCHPPRQKPSPRLALIN